MIDVRLAGPADDDDVDRLRSGARRWTTTQRGGEYLGEDPPRGATVLLGTIGGVAVGLASVADGVPTSTLHELFVEPGARRVGVGHRLLVEVLDHVRRAGATGLDSWALPGDRDTKNFFEAHGLVTRQLIVHRSLER